MLSGDTTFPSGIRKLSQLPPQRRCAAGDPGAGADGAERVIRMHRDRRIEVAGINSRASEIDFLWAFRRLLICIDATTWVRYTAPLKG